MCYVTSSFFLAEWAKPRWNEGFPKGVI